MRIVVATPLYPPGSLVGAWLTTHEFAADLAARGHEVDAVQTLSRSRFYEHEGVRVHAGSGALVDLLRGADVCVSHAGDNGAPARLAADAGVPSIRMVHGRSTPAGQLDGAALVVYSSHNVAASTDWHGPSIVAHPPVDPERYRVEPAGHEIGAVGLSTPKGGDVVWQMARVLGDRRFVFVRGGYGRQQIRRLANAEVLDPMPDPRPAYARMRVLLHPSSDETWGRVPVEAALSGIPVIATPTPGTLETLADAAIYVEQGDRAGWRQAIEDLDDPDRWAEASRVIRARTEAMDLRAPLDVFARAIEGVS
jgi:glycosyltransferase involved in cell wall biosynthesis